MRYPGEATPVRTRSAGRRYPCSYTSTMLTTCSGGRSRQVPRACIYKYPVIGLNIGILIQSAPQIFGEVMGELFRLFAAGVLGRSYPTI